MNAIVRKFQVEMNNNGELNIHHPNTGMTAHVGRTSNGDWIYNIYSSPTSQQAEAFEGFESQWECYGACLSKMWELST